MIGIDTLPENYYKKLPKAGYQINFQFTQPQMQL